MDFDKILSRIWRIVGISVGVVFLAGFLIMVVGMLFSFVGHKRHHVEGLAVDSRSSDEELKLSVEFGLPLSVSELDHFIVPVRLEKRKYGEERIGLYSRASASKSYDGDSWGRGSYSYGYGGPYYNLIFVNKLTGESRALLADNGYITSIYFPEKNYNKEKDAVRPTFMLIEMARYDTNNDGVINQIDASAGFIAALGGLKLTQVTPENAQMKAWYFDEKVRKLFIEIVRDINNDKKFNWDDPQTVLVVDLESPQMGREIVSEKIRNLIQKQLQN
jgi:hypothetical protein